MQNETFDLIVVGGGIVGAGVALDAATRGLTVALVEARDWASGTSGRSSKLIHGGVRYLEQRRFRLVREALRERALLLTRLAPHLVHPVSFLLPLRRPGWDRLYYGCGLALYDLMGGGRAVPRHRHLTRKAVRRRARGLRPDSVVGAIEYFDAQMDDTRFALTVVRTAVNHGAAAVSGLEVTGLRTGRGGRVEGVSVLDHESGDEFELCGRSVIMATGVWTEEVTSLLGRQSEAQRPEMVVRMSKGVHLVVPRSSIDLETGLVLRTETSVLFVIPWHEHWLIGTTDTEWAGDRDDPRGDAADVDYLLARLNDALRVPLTRGAVTSVYAALRPLVDDAAEHTARVSREHSVARLVNGLTVIAGGKYTTYRIMAKDAVDAAVADLPVDVPPSVTDSIVLSGADGFAGLWNRRTQLARQSGLGVGQVERLLGRYGTATSELLEMIAEEPGLGAAVGSAGEYLRVEIAYAVLHEDARHVEDVLRRRTRISMEVDDLGATCVEEVCAIMAPLLGWSQNDATRENWHFRVSLERERWTQYESPNPDLNDGRQVAAHGDRQAAKPGVLVRSRGSRPRDTAS